MAGSFRDLRVWHDAMQLTREVYEVTTSFPKLETYGLTQQLRRAVVSVPSNIAEGKGHYSNKEFVHFLLHARGSLFEVQTQLIIAHQLQYVMKPDSDRLLELTEKVGRALSGLINSLGVKAIAPEYSSAKVE